MLASSPSRAVTAVYLFGNVSSETAPTSPNLTGSENLSELFFNLDPSLNPLNLNFSYVGGGGGFTLPVISTGVDQFKADGDGKYDILFAFGEGQSAFAAGQYVAYQISGIPGLTASDFAYLSTPAAGNGPFYLAAHVQRIGAQSSSGWIAGIAGGTPVVPEPGSAAFAMLGAGVFWFGRRLRRR
jgi:hypothetical protein